MVKKLSFEHVPPESAFNDRRILRAEFQKLIEADDLDHLSYRVQQRGAGAFTLCEKCNSDTGLWYVPAYGDWATQAMSILMATSGRPTLTILYRLFPLRVLKQIVCMFFSVNGPTFQIAQRELVRFVLNKESREFPEKCSRLLLLYLCGSVSIFGRDWRGAGAWNESIARPYFLRNDISAIRLRYGRRRIPATAGRPLRYNLVFEVRLS
jgi:hypothetical protein